MRECNENNTHTFQESSTPNQRKAATLDDDMVFDQITI